MTKKSKKPARTKSPDTVRVVLGDFKEIAERAVEQLAAPRPFVARVGAICAYICTTDAAHVLFAVHRAEGVAPESISCACGGKMLNVGYSVRRLNVLLPSAIDPARWVELFAPTTKGGPLVVHTLPIGSPLPMVDWSRNVVRDVDEELKKLAGRMSAKLREAADLLAHLRLAGVEVDLSVVGNDGEGFTVHEWTGEFSIDYKRVALLARGES